MLFFSEPIEMPAEHLHYLTTGLAIRPENYFGQGSVEIETPKPGSGEGGVRRLAITAHELVEQPHPTVRTIPDVIAYAVRTYGSNYNAVGWRDVIKVHEEVRELNKVVAGEEVKEKKTWKLYELSNYKFLNYVEFAEAIREVRNGLLKIGIRKEDVVNVYSQTGYVRVQYCVFF
jgi:long-chain acyl-CoA synthetase